MRPSELFSGARAVPVALGLTPKLQALRAKADGEAKDESIPLWQPLAKAPEASNVWHHQQVQDLILKFWDLYRKDEDNTISEDDFSFLILRFLRIFLPGLKEDEEQRLCQNCWQEASAGRRRLSFVGFFPYIVRLVQSWTDSNDPNDYVVFLQNLLDRCTCFQVGQNGEELVFPKRLVTFRAAQRGDDLGDGYNDFMECVELVCSGTLEEAKVELQFEVQHGINFHSGFFEEQFEAPNEPFRRVWMELSHIWPLGYAALLAIRTLRDQPPMTLDCSGKKGDLMQAALETLRSEAASQVVCQVEDGKVLCGQSDFTAQQFFGAVVNEGMISASFVMKPDRGSFMHKLSDVRKHLLLPQSNAHLAAESMGTAKPQQVLPTFPDLLSGAVVVDPSTALAKPEETESLLESGSLRSISDMYIVSKILRLPATDNALEEPLPEEVPQAIYDAFTAQFPASSSGADQDLINLARTSPLVLWIFGQCDVSGDYKTEVCRRLAEKMQLQWLQPNYVLELATKTPEKFRSPLQRRCVEQLQRGMVVSLKDALRLTMEMMASALCKTNGYILDFPAVSPEEIQEVSEFFEQVQDLSGKTEVPWGEVLQDSLELPPLAPEPEPPKPPVEEEEEVPAEGDGGDGDPATDDAAVVEAPAEAEADPVSADAEASADAPADGEGEGGEGEVKEPVAPVPEAPKPNCWANVLPRRMVILSMEKDELGEWRLQTLKKKQEEKDRIRRELEEAGEEVPEEEEEEPEELQQLPEDEEEQQALFDKMAGDQLRTMAPYVPLKSLEPPKRLPAENPESNLEPETIDRQALKQGEIKAVEAMRRSCPLPLLSLQMDGRPPEMAAELLEVFTGPCGHRVPLPVQLEGGGEAKELLRLNLEPAQASRLWSPWRLHCPVSLYEKQLTPGVEEFAVDYAGYVFLFASEEKLQRFRQWPKRFLTEMPCINAPGLTLGFVLLSPASFRANALSHRLRDVYGFNIINVLDLLQRALKQPPMPEEVPEEGTVPIPLETEPYLLATEYQDLRQGKTVSTSTFLRLIAKELGIEKNLALIQKQAEALEEVKKLLEEAQAAGNDPPEGITLDDEGQPVVNLEEPLATPTKGYVLQGFPESAEQLEALKQRLGLVPDQVLLLKPMGEEAPETLEILQKHGLEDQPLQPILETQLASFEGLSAVEGLKISEVALETSEEEQFVQIRKHIDPFYEVVEAENMAAEIPDPEEWTPPEEDPEDGAEPEERPVISWGTCGPYCPVTLKEQRWLYPGQKDFQHVYRNVVFAVGNEKASEAFVREPVAYVEAEPVLPPPRILVTGPTGSGVAKQCEMLGQVYKIPVLKLEEIWRQKVEKRLTLVKEARKAAMKKEALEQSMLEDDKPLFPEGWMPPEEVPDDGEELQEEAPPEPEEDGLDDEQREELFVMAMKDTLGPHCGACILDGTWFGDLNDEEMAEEIKTARSLQNLLVKAQRLPDFTLVLKCKNDFAAKNTFDFDTIDREYEARLADYKAQVAAAEAKEEDPPEPPEGLVVDETEEKESDRVKARFLETKATQQQALKDMMEVFQASRAPLQKVPSDRGDVPTHKAIRCLCRPFVEQRGSLLLRHQLTKVSPYKAKDQLQRGLLQSSSFGNASPTVLDAPNFPNQTPGVRLQNRIYYPQSESELTQFMQDPALYLKNPGPSPVQVSPAISVVGSPLSGKTCLARQLAERTGAIYISVSEALTSLMFEAVPCQLSKDIRSALQAGQRVPDALVIQAIRFRLLSPEVLQHGWVLDDFPCTKAQAEGLSACGIVPHRVFMLLAPEAVIYSRAAELKKASMEGQELQQELALQRERLEGFRSLSPALRIFYSTVFENVRDIDASRSKWAIFDRALQETTLSVRERLTYYRRTANSLATRVKGMCFTSVRLENVSPWKHYCPVTLSLRNELVPSYDRSCAVEYHAKVYWMATEEYAELFTEDPEAFLQVPLPANLPRLLDDGERARKAEARAELKDFCPVTLVETGKLVKASAFHLVEYNQNLFRFASREAAMKFMRQPLRYRTAKLPRKLPPEVSKEEREASHLLSCLVKGKDGRGLQASDMVTYMQASVAELICQGLVECGERRPLFPGKGPEESALLCLSRFLRARNPLNTEMYAGTMNEEREDFLKGCALPSDLKEMTEKKMSPDYAWTSTENAKFQELCARFDEVFPQRS